MRILTLDGETTLRGDADAAEDGLVRFEGLAPGSYRVEVITDRPWSSKASGGAADTASAGESAPPPRSAEAMLSRPVRLAGGGFRRMEFDLSTTPSVAGRVLHRGQAVAGISVKLEPVSGEGLIGPKDSPLAWEHAANEIRTWTDQDGGYRFDRLWPGSFHLKARLASDGAPLSKTLALQEGETLREDLVFDGTRVRGRLLRAADGTPISEVSFGVVCFGPGAQGELSSLAQGKSPDLDGKTDAEGRFAITELPFAGRHLIRVRHPDFVYHDIIVEGSNAPSDLDLGDISLKRGATLELRIRASEEREGFHLRLRPVNPRAATSGTYEGARTLWIMREEGGAEIMGLRAGRYALELLGHDEEPARLLRELTFQEGQTIEFTL